jgi:beta-N-acetylglucosaminidase
LDIKIYASKQKKLNQRTAFLITHFPLFTTIFTSQLAKEAEFKNAQPYRVFSSNITHFDLSLPFPFLALLQFLGYENGLR